MNQRFTSYDRSTVASLDYAVNRSYANGQGRFTSVDPIGMGASSLDNPQSLNLYAYVQNNPIDFVDPSGLLIVMCHGEHIVYRIRDKNGNWVNKDGGYTQTCVIINDGNTGGNRSGGNRGGGGGGGIHEAVPEEQKTRCPPNIADLLKKHPDWFPPVVEKVLAQASKDNPNRVDPGYYKEVGGWILMNPRNGVVEAYIKPSEPAPKPDYYDHDKKRWVWTRGDTTLGVMLDSPGMNSGALERLRQGWVVVADFHSHANKFQSPGKDQQLADDYKIPGIWIYPDATFEVYGPNRGIMNKGVPKGCPKN